jgi:hypothetical protein
MIVCSSATFALTQRGMQSSVCAVICSGKCHQIPALRLCDLKNLQLAVPSPVAGNKTEPPSLSGVQSGNQQRKSDSVVR